MKDDTRKRMAKKIASKTLISSQGTSLSSVLQLGSSQARLAMEQIEGIYDKAIALIEDSKQKEHIYSEAGDMITNMRELIERMDEGLAIVSYAASRIDQRKLKNKFPAHIRDGIDDAVKRDT